MTKTRISSSKIQAVTKTLSRKWQSASLPQVIPTAAFRTPGIMRKMIRFHSERIPLSRRKEARQLLIDVARNADFLAGTPAALDDIARYIGTQIDMSRRFFLPTLMPNYTKLNARQLREPWILTSTRPKDTRWAICNRGSFFFVRTSQTPPTHTKNHLSTY